MHNIPLACMRFEVGNKIGSFIGYVEDVDTDEDGVGWENLFTSKDSRGFDKTSVEGEAAKITGSFYVDSIPI